MALVHSGAGDIEDWLEKHHHVVPPSDLNADEIHVFAIQILPVFKEVNANEKCYEAEFGLGPVTIKVEACFDLAAGTVSVCVYAKISFFPWVKLGCITGSIANGVTIKFDVKIIKGLLHFYVKDHWFWVHYEVTIFTGKQFTGDIKLFPVPF